MNSKADDTVNIPQWTVVITTRNRAQMLSRAIKSCLRQTAACDVLVVDEASTDGTPEMVKNFPSIRYIRNSAPLGHSASANIGIRESRTEWVKPLDDDDWLAPKCIEAMSDAVAKARAAGLAPTLISGTAANVTLEEHEIGRTRGLSAERVALRSRDLLHLMMLDQAAVGTPVQVGHSREAALKVGGWNEQRVFKHQHGDETEFWIKLAGTGDAVFVFDLVGYRTLWAGGSQDMIPPEERFRSNLFIKDQIAAQLGSERPRSIASYLALHWAVVAARQREYGQAFRLGLTWMRRPVSAIHLLASRRSGLAEKRAIPL